MLAASDYLPKSTGEDWPEQVRELRDQAKAIPDELLVVLVGDMVTEEALPTYQSLLNGFEGVSDRSCWTPAPGRAGPGLDG